MPHVLFDERNLDALYNGADVTIRSSLSEE